MEEIKTELSKEEMDQVSGGFMPSCFHPTVKEYLGKTRVSMGEKQYLWRCGKCNAEIWVLNVPKTGGATGTW